MGRGKVSTTSSMPVVVCPVSRKLAYVTKLLSCDYLGFDDNRGRVECRDVQAVAVSIKPIMIARVV